MGEAMCQTAAPGGCTLGRIGDKEGPAQGLPRFCLFSFLVWL